MSERLNPTEAGVNGNFRANGRDAPANQREQRSVLSLVRCGQASKAAAQMSLYVRDLVVVVVVFAC